MAHLTSKTKGIRLDNSAGSLTAISGSVESASLEHAMTILQDTGFGDSTHTTVAGLAAATRIPLSGFLDTTTEAIFGPLIGKHTSITKTAEYKVNTTLLYNGEFWPENVVFGGGVDELQTWSCDLVLQNGTLNRTSKAL